MFRNRSETIVIDFERFGDVEISPAQNAFDEDPMVTCIGVGHSVLSERFEVYLSTSQAVRAPMIDFVRDLPLAVAQMEELLTRVPAGRAREGHEEGTAPWTTER
jgi:hypothetical protein